MSADDLLKLVIGVASAFAGWLLAQLTSGLKTWLQRRKVRKLLLEELSDLDFEVNRILLFFSRQLQIYGAQGVSSETSANISNPIFKNYYKDALLSLNQKQRVSYQLIHSLVDLANGGIAELRRKSSEIYEIHAKEGMTPELSKICEAWGKIARAQYLSCAGLQWQIRFHLDNRTCPDLTPNTEHHQRYLRHLQSASEKANSLIESGKKLGRDGLNQIHN